MQVFKYYFKLAGAMRGSIMVFVGTFVFANVAMMMQVPNGQANFSIQKPNVAVFNHDNGTFAHGLTDYISRSSTIVTVADTTEARKEAIYFQTVDALYEIPAHFSEDFFAGKQPQMTVTRGSGQGAAQADALVSNYLRLTEPRVLAGIDQKTTVDSIATDTAKQVTIATKRAANLSEVGKSMYFMNMLVYIILGLNIMIISTIMLLFNRDMIRRRNIVSGLPGKSATLQLLAGNAVFSLGIWLILMVVAAIMTPGALFSPYGALYAAGSFIFSLVGLAIGFMVGTLVQNRRTIPGITNVLALGMSFLCGVFMPQQFLGDSVLAVSKIMPAYWYVHANGLIAALSDINTTSLQPVFIDLAITLGFAIAIFAATYIIAGVRRGRA